MLAKARLISYVLNIWVINCTAYTVGCSTDLVVGVEYTVQKDIITIVPVYQDYQATTLKNKL